MRARQTRGGPPTHRSRHLLSTNRASTDTMSRVSSTSVLPTSFETIFTAALNEYEKQTKRDIASHPLATQLQSCSSSSAIIAMLRTQVQTFDKGTDERWTKWLDPTVNVLYAFSTTLGNGVGVVTYALSNRSRYDLLMCTTTGIPTSKCNFYWNWRPSSSKLPRRPRMCALVTDIS